MMLAGKVLFHNNNTVFVSAFLHFMDFNVYCQFQFSMLSNHSLIIFKRKLQNIDMTAACTLALNILDFKS